jgi:hypothetical protein
MSVPVLLLPSQVLAAAADVIERNGWLQRDFFQATAGRDPKTCPACVDAAISIAAGRHPEFGVEPFDHNTVPLAGDPDKPTEWALDGPDAEVMEVIAAARAVFARHIRNVIGYRSALPDAALITHWNDVAGRTAGEVVRELRAAAAAAREDGR